MPKISLCTDESSEFTMFATSNRLKASFKSQLNPRKRVSWGFLETRDRKGEQNILGNKGR